MKNYTGYTAEQFACDPDFVRWTTAPGADPALDAFWAVWMAGHPEQRDEIDEAQLMIQAVREEPKFVPSEAVQQQVWQRIGETAGLPKSKQRSMLVYWYSAAAMVLMGVSLGWWMLQSQPTFHVPSARLAAKDDAPLKVKKNDTALPITVELEDQSIVVLQPNSALRYPAHFKDSAREVDLVGEAFFEVKKDPRRPFLVYTDEIVTRVLGTSFTVKNFRDDVRVQVKTGRVTVVKDRGEATSTQASDAPEGVILHPNQQVVYTRNVQKMTKSLVDNPSVLTPVAKQEFEFTDVAVNEVFRSITEAYGVDIVYDAQLLANCRLTASLTDVSLHNKLKLICKALDASYDIIDSHIVIYGKGCANP